jgi:ABC-type Co2+ transport system permease subunit
MGPWSSCFSWVWAVHISDGVLATPWLCAGFVVAGLLALLGSLRIKDEEIPRIALLTAAFFVASLLHIRLGPTSVHLLFNGLVGVILGWRAAMAIFVGLFLQAALLGHGGFTTLGVNACVLTIPAILAGWLFATLHRLWWVCHPWFRACLIAMSIFTWFLSLAFSLILFLTNPWTSGAVLEVGRAIAFITHPIVLALALGLGIMLAQVERRFHTAPEFPLGLLIGVVTVAATLLLHAVVLIWGGAEDWHTIALLVVLAHLPVAAIEGVVLGFTIGFLVRVKPGMLASYSRPDAGPADPSQSIQTSRSTPSPVGIRVPAVLLALGGLLGIVAPVQAHRLEGEYKVLPNREVLIESWFDQTDNPPKGARVVVTRSDGSVLTEGQMDDKGLFHFHYTDAEPLKVLISAGGGHTKEIVIPVQALEGASGTSSERQSFADHSPRVSIKDVLIGIAVLLSAAAFVLGLRNARELREMKQRNE